MSETVKILREAMNEAATLSKADQEKIGRGVLSHVEKLRRLRIEIDKGIVSLDAGEGSELNVEEFLLQANRRHGGA